MTDLLKREFAPITERAWEEIDEQATRVIQRNLCARRVVDVSGPHGWQHGAVDLGRIHLAENPAEFGVQWGTRELLPLIELRVPFTLDRIELDNVSRGCKDPDLDAVQQAAEQIARFEDTAVFTGFGAGQIKGIAETVTQKPVPLPKDPAAYPDAVSAGLKMISLIGIGGPYTLILGPDEYFGLAAYNKGYPPYKVIKDMTDGEILMCPALVGGILLSARGGDFELTVGQDLAIGYQYHDAKHVELYLTESFTFRTLEPAAAVPLTRPK